MIRKLLVPLIAAAALSGCASDYYHRGSGGGDYYYGSPAHSTYYGAPYSSLGYGAGGWYGGVGYGYNRYPPYRRHYGYGGWGGSPYYGGLGYYGYSRWPYGYYPHHPRPRPRPDDERPPVVERVTGGNQPPRRMVAPQPQRSAPAVHQRMRRSGGDVPLMRPAPRPGMSMPAPQQPRMQQRRTSQPLSPPAMRPTAPASPPRMSQPAPRPQMAAPRATSRPAPRMERRPESRQDDRRFEP